MKKFKPLTKGGYKYEIFAERDGELWGRIDIINVGWRAAVWEMSGNCIGYSIDYEQPKYFNKTQLDLIQEDPEIIMIENVVWKLLCPPNSNAPDLNTYVSFKINTENRLPSFKLADKKGKLVFYVEEDIK